MAKTVFRTTSKQVQRAYVAEFEAGDVIFSEGDPGDQMYIIHSGRVEMFKGLGEQERQVTVLEKGDFFGEMSVLEDIPRTASSRAMEKTTTLVINGSTFDQMIHENPEIVVRMMRKMSSRLRQMEERIQDLAEQSQLEGPARPQPKPEPPPHFEISERPDVTESTGIFGSGKVDEAARRAPRLIDENGMNHGLSAGRETTIGRRDPVTGIDPDVDLTDIDVQRSTSRRHAKLYLRGRRYFLREEIGTTNGTFVNDDRLETGVPAELKDGDQLRFGLVKMTFRAGE